MVTVDTYGGSEPTEGGVFRGKVASKVDRSASCMARHIARKIVAAKLVEKCHVQIACAVGATRPPVLHGGTLGTEATVTRR